jgi:hypothetical protein
MSAGDCGEHGEAAEPAAPEGPPVGRPAMCGGSAACASFCAGRYHSPTRANGHQRPLIGHLLDTAAALELKLLISLARPTGIEPVFPP